MGGTWNVCGNAIQLFENLVEAHSGVAAVQFGARMWQMENGHVSPDAFEFYGMAPVRHFCGWR